MPDAHARPDAQPLTATASPAGSPRRASDTTGGATSPTLQPGAISRRRSLFVLPALLLVTACGFQLRGTKSGNLPYKTIFIALPETSDVRIWLERYIKASASSEISNDSQQAEATFQQLSDTRAKTILSVNAQGRAREYRLQLTYSFRLVNAKGQVLVKPNEITLSRDITFDDANVLAKDLEENLLWRDMNNDLVNQIMRRLSIIQPRNPDREEDD